MDFTAIDFETANSYRGSPCAVGLVKVRGGQVVERFQTLIRPPAVVDYFDPWNTMIHGITAEDVADAPGWAQVLPIITEFIGDDIVVAHNASFDIGVIRYACAADEIPAPDLRFACSLVLARRHLRLPSYRLPFVLDAYGQSLTDHHDALADALGAASVIGHLAADTGAGDIVGLAQVLGTRIGTLTGGQYRGATAAPSSGSNSGSTRLVVPDANPDADPEGYLYGRVVVFTGAMSSMTRQEAFDAVARAGGRPDKSTTRRTNILVLGDFNPANLRPGATLSNKAQRAFELQDAGQDIELMTEADFLEALDGDALLSPEQAALAQGATAPEPAPTRAVEPETPPKPLHRKPQPTDQICAIEGCTNTAAFRTRSKPTWCEPHILAMVTQAGLTPLEPFTHPESFWLLTCTACGCEAHYRFAYLHEKLTIGETVCRACYWIEWAGWARRRQEDAFTTAGVDPAEFGGFTGEVIPFGEPGADRLTAEEIANDSGHDYLGKAPGSVDGFTHRAQCRRCGRISVERTSDLSYPCPCRPR